MTQEDKELLLRDLVARIPYGVVVNCTDGDVQPISVDFEKGYDNPEFWHDGPGSNINFNDDNIKPYLRPMSSMTDEEKFAYRKTQRVYQADYCAPEEFDGLESYDWLDKKHFDYRGLIEKGLAIDATGLNIY